MNPHQWKWTSVTIAILAACSIMFLSNAQELPVVKLPVMEVVKPAAPAPVPDIWETKRQELTEQIYQLEQKIAEVRSALGTSEFVRDSYNEMYKHEEDPEKRESILLKMGELNTTITNQLVRLDTLLKFREEYATFEVKFAPLAKKK